MKLFKRYFLVLCLSVLLSVGFSTIVSADETILDNLKVNIVSEIYQNRQPYLKPNDINIIIYPNNNTVEKGNYGQIIPAGAEYQFRQTWKFSNIDGNLLFKGRKEVRLTLENAYYNVGYSLSPSTSPSQTFSSTYVEPKYNRALIVYYDGTMEYFDFTDGGKIGRPTTLYLTFTPQKDVTSIEFIINTGHLDFTDTSYCYKFWYNVGEFETDKCFNLIVETESEESGLLKNIIAWIKDIYDGIVNLPQKIWQFISDGLKGLFIPSEESLDEFKSKLDLLLEQKLGAIYQVVNILLEGWDSISSNDVTNTIDFPEVTIPLPNDNTFSFGGQSVRIVPEGFEFLATAIKLITGISCTVLFVNGLKKRYDEIMGG